jgi:sec-independent protein translocase protein TatA
MGGIGVWQIAIVVVVVILLFGAGRLPRLMGDMAKGIKSFKQGMKEELNTSNDEEDLTRVSDKPKEKDKTANS